MWTNLRDINFEGKFMVFFFFYPWSVEECRTLLAQCGAREITPYAVARTLGMMARTPQSLGSHVSQVRICLRWCLFLFWRVDVLFFLHFQLSLAMICCTNFFFYCFQSYVCLRKSVLSVNVKEKENLWNPRRNFPYFSYFAVEGTG